MQGLLRGAVRYCHEYLHIKKQGYSARESTLDLIKGFSHKGHIKSSPSSLTKYRKCFNDATGAPLHSMPEKGLQNTTVAEVLMTKGEEKVGSWLWCRTDDTVYEAVKQVSFFSASSLQQITHLPLSLY